MQDGKESTSVRIQAKFVSSEALKLISFIYAIVCCIAGIVIPTAEALKDSWLDTVFGAAFLTYQLIVGIAFLVYLIILSYVIRRRGQSHQVEDESNLASVENGLDTLKDDMNHNHLRKRSSICLNSRPVLNRKTDKSDLDTTSIVSTNSSTKMIWVDVSEFGDVFSHPETSLFLRIGSLIFSLGNLINYGFEGASYLWMDPSCPDRARFGWTFFLRLVFVLLQTYFMFKRPDVHIRGHQSVIWFGMLHLVSTNLCLWFRTVINEILEESHHQHPKVKNHTYYYNPPINVSALEGPGFDPHHPGDDDRDGDDSCDNSMVVDMARYLFPFVLEYSLIAFGTIGAILHSLSSIASSEGKTLRDIRNAIRVISFSASQTSTAADEKSAPTASPSSSSSSSSSSLSPVDSKQDSMLSKSHTGFFLGALVMTGVVISTILFFFFMRKKSKNPFLPTIIYLATDICLQSFLLVGCVVAFVLMRPLAYVPKVISIDDALIIIAMCGSLVLDLAIIISDTDAITCPVGSPRLAVEKVRLAASIVTFIQVIVQSMFLICALRRYASCRRHVETMPGRGVITALIIGNVAVWIHKTILAKVINTESEQEYYGDVPWLLIVNINLPLSLFFRFHCGICFADVWHLAYRPLTPILAGDAPPPSECHRPSIDTLDTVSTGRTTLYTIARSRSNSVPNILGNSYDLKTSGRTMNFGVIDENLDNEIV